MGSKDIKVNHVIKTMTSYQRKYTNAKKKLLEDKTIHEGNRKLFDQFFRHQEYKLKRINGLHELDESTYNTLYGYILRFRNVNRWFENVPLKDITKDDIKRVYDGLEDGRIVNHKGLPYKSRADYYSKVFKSKLFQLAGKAELAREVIEFTIPNRHEVRFIREKDFRRLTRRVRQPRNHLLFWLAWDYGENICALLQLRPEDFHRQIDEKTGDPEYRLHFRPEILKRSRRSRSEISNYQETVDLLDDILPTIPPGQRIYNFGYRYAKKIMDTAAKSSRVLCEPKSQRVTWKDLRSGMACDLLGKGWNRDEVNARLGHKPSSDEIDKYINFLAIDRRGSKQKLIQHRQEVMPQQQNEFIANLLIQQEQMRKQMEQMKQVISLQKA